MALDEIPYQQLKLASEYAHHTGNTISFALDAGRPRCYGFDGTPITGNLTFAVTDANSLIMVKVLHNQGTVPTVTPPGGVTAILEGGEYSVSVDNILYAICHKNAAGTVTKISYSWTQDQA